ncbi:MAG: MotA/TolQ/ExbB proton channel family protein [Candidatus Coatesbacteria bacterium]|nr:MotA/TolQ/ExbB proton channel family protein [Candidatus Coatesbacteria bacterium]
MNFFSYLANEIKEAFASSPIDISLILLCAIIATAVSIERLIVCYSSRIDARRFLYEIVNLIKQGNYKKAIAYCKREKGPVPRIARIAIENRQDTKSAIQGAIDEAVIQETPRLEARLPALATIANVATQLGLLGTIIGLMESFKSLAQYTGEQKGAALAGGIKAAMYTTEAGLIVAIPTLVVHAWIQGLVDGIINDIDETALKVMNALVAGR